MTEGKPTTGRPPEPKDRRQPTDVHFGVGLNADGNAEAAAAAACLQARKAIAPARVKCLFLCDNFEGRRAEVLAGACSVVPPEVVHGVVTFSQFSHEAAPPAESVGALAIGGEDIEIEVAAVPTIRDREKTSGADLGRRLKSAIDGAERGKLLILVGDCHVPKNEQLLQGVQEVLGTGLPIIGCSAKLVPDVCIYHEGRPVEQGGLAVLLSGRFRIGLAGATVGWKKGTPQEICASAGSAVAAVLDDLKTTPDLVLAFDCGGRRGLLLKGDPTRVAGELDEMRRVLPGGVPLLTMYGSGEMGHMHRGEAATAAGFHIMLCAIAAVSTDPREHTA